MKTIAELLELPELPDFSKELDEYSALKWEIEKLNVAIQVKQLTQELYDLKPELAGKVMVIPAGLLNPLYNFNFFYETVDTKEDMEKLKELQGKMKEYWPEIPA